MIYIAEHEKEVSAKLLLTYIDLFEKGYISPLGEHILCSTKKLNEVRGYIINAIDKYDAKKIPDDFHQSLYKKVDDMLGINFDNIPELFAKLREKRRTIF